MGFFAMTVSFAAVGGTELPEAYEGGGVYVMAKDGVFEVESGRKSFYSEAKSSDLDYKAADSAVSLTEAETALAKVGKRDNRQRNSASYQTDTEAHIYDDNLGYIKADYPDDWSLILINKKYHIPDDYKFELAVVKGLINADVRVAPHLLEMIQTAKSQGVILYICSPYRDEEKQQELFDKKKASYIKKGMSEKEAYDLASQTVAIPGTSEHQVGLAFDFITEGYMQLDEGFEETDAGKWLKENSADFGFILRYPKGKEEITEIEYEPWHYRYVGEAAAHEIMDRNITLEEYVVEIGMNYDAPVVTSSE